MFLIVLAVMAGSACGGSASNHSPSSPSRAAVHDMACLTTLNVTNSTMMMGIASTAGEATSTALHWSEKASGCVLTVSYVGAATGWTQVVFDSKTGATRDSSTSQTSATKPYSSGSPNVRVANGRWNSFAP
jgi:hypothetical protein